MLGEIRRLRSKSPTMSVIGILQQFDPPQPLSVARSTKFVKSLLSFGNI
jgi:hypothetical protein